MAAERNRVIAIVDALVDEQQQPAETATRCAKCWAVQVESAAVISAVLLKARDLIAQGCVYEPCRESA